MHTQHLVVIGYVWPEPASSAAGENMLNLLLAFIRRNWNVTFLTAASDSAHKADLNALGIHTQTIALNCSSFDGIIKLLSPDAVVFDRFMIEEQFSWRVRQACPDAMHILNTEDLHSLRQRRQQSVKNGTAESLDFSDAVTQRELAAILRSDITLIISSREYQLLIDEFNVPPQQLLLSPLLISSADTLNAPPFEQRSGFVFIGNFRHAPNWDAAMTLKKTLWPAIRKHLKQATLHLYGAYPAKKVTDLHKPEQGFIVEGWAEDARHAISQHKVMLAPLTFGAGIKGKLVTAMQCNTPSVTTMIGAEGIAPAANWPGAVTLSDEAFVDSAIALYQHPDIWQEQIPKSAAILADKFDTPQNQNALVNRIERGITDLPQHRSQLFLQHLLWNETLRSTQYMSQWIEAKNRPR